MKYNKDLVQIVKKHNFKTFWHCLDYLIMAGYPTMDAFGVSLLEFGEERVYSDVAYIRHDRSLKPLLYDGRLRLGAPIIIVGVIDETNIHLSGFYKHYRGFLVKTPTQVPQLEIESTCELIRVESIGTFITDYLITLSEKHFGFKAFDHPQIEQVNFENHIGDFNIDGLPNIQWGQAVQMDPMGNRIQMPPMTRLREDL